MTEKEIFLYLDLNGKLDVNYFQNNKIFFKMINMDKKPMVQIGNYVFEGKYEDYLGTKVFFVENKDYEPSGNIFERQSAIHLKYFMKTAKVLQLKWKSVPVPTAQETKIKEEYMNLAFRESYSSVLEKFERAELNIKDIAVKSTDEEKLGSPLEENLDETNEAEMEVVRDTAEVDEAMEVEQPVSNDITVTKHEIFKEYIRLPKKQVEEQKLYEVRNENLVDAVDAANYPVLKQLFLQNVALDDIDLSREDFGKYVDIEKSISDGVILEMKMDALTDELKGRLLHSDNFGNFTLPMKMAYLLIQLEQYKKRMKEIKNADNLKRADQFGRTLVDKYRLLKQLVKDLWYIVYLDKPVSS